MNHEIYLIITTIHMVFWVFVYRIRYKRTDPFDPFYLIGALYWLIFVWAPGVWIDRGQTMYQGVQVMAYLPEATLVFNVAYAAFSMGSVGLQKRKRAIAVTRSLKSENSDFLSFLNFPESQKFILRYAWIVFVVSFGLALIYYRLVGRSLWFMLTMGQGEELDPIRSGQGIYFLMQFIRSAIPGLLLLIAFQDKYRWGVYVCTYLLCAVCISTGSRNLAICVVLAIFVYHYMKDGKRPSFPTIIVAIVILYLFVTIIGLFRGEIRTGGEIDMSSVDQESMQNSFMFNVEIFYPFYTLIGYTNDGLMDCHNGLGVLNVIIQFIPRVIWPGKPATLGATAFEAMYGDSMGGAAYPNLGEFYYEFGFIGAVLLMFFFGMFTKKIFERCRYSKNPLTLIMYAILFGYMMQFVCRGHFASWVLDFVFMFVPLFVLNYLLKRRYRDYQVSAHIKKKKADRIKEIELWRRKFR